jgi:hypothetical protein
MKVTESAPSLAVNPSESNIALRMPSAMAVRVAIPQGDGFPAHRHA